MQNEPVEGRDLVIRIERTWALDAAAFADVLSEQDPSWGSRMFGLADGVVVLCGPGLYVNRALAAGIEEQVTHEHLDLLEQRSRAVGVRPAIEVTDVTMPSVRNRIVERLYRPSDETTAMIRTLDDVDLIDVDPAIVIEPATGDLLPVWQSTSAAAWGHTEPEARRASDAFVGAAARIDGPGMVLARSADDGRPLGCASLTVRDGLATLGGMSTLPEERRRGVHSALIWHRLRLAKERGCELASTSALRGQASERNLVRHGFTRLHAKATFGHPVVTPHGRDSTPLPTTRPNG